MSPLDTDEGILVASAIRDITERIAEAERARLLQERAAHVEANRIKDEFLATLSHELRTPLNAILGWISLIEAQALPPDKAPVALATIARNARSQAQLVEDLLDVSRILSGKLRLQRSALDLVDVADAAVAVVQPAADAKQIDVDVRYDSRPILIVGDADRLQQVIWNLLSNAIKFTPAHGRVGLRVGVTGGDVEILVRDTGKGISPAFLPHAFDDSAKRIAARRDHRGASASVLPSHARSSSCMEARLTSQVPARDAARPFACICRWRRESNVGKADFPQ